MKELMLIGNCVTSAYIAVDREKIVLNQSQGHGFEWVRMGSDLLYFFFHCSIRTHNSDGLSSILKKMEACLNHVACFWLTVATPYCPPLSFPGGTCSLSLKSENAIDCLRK